MACAYGCGEHVCRGPRTKDLARAGLSVGDSGGAHAAIDGHLLHHLPAASERSRLLTRDQQLLVTVLESGAALDAAPRLSQSPGGADLIAGYSQLLRRFRALERKTIVDAETYAVERTARLRIEERARELWQRVSELEAHSSAVAPAKDGL